MSNRYLVIPNTDWRAQPDKYKYVVLDTAKPSDQWVYKIGPFVTRGPRADCQRKADELNYKQALYLMTRGTPAETLEPL